MSRPAANVHLRHRHVVIAKPDPKTPGIDATWVGIGGANTTDLIQPAPRRR